MNVQFQPDQIWRCDLLGDQLVKINKIFLRVKTSLIDVDTAQVDCCGVEKTVGLYTLHSYFGTLPFRFKDEYRD